MAVLGTVASVAFAGINTWTTSGPPSYADSVIADSGGIVYAGTGNGVFKSLDKGATWLSGGLTGQQATVLAAGATGTVYASTLVPIPPSPLYTTYKTTDGGGQWNEILTGRGYVIVAASGQSTVYASQQFLIPNTSASGGYLSRSNDGGMTWTQIGPDHVYITAFALDPRTSGTIYAATVGTVPTLQTAGVIYKSDDGGDTWVSLGNSPLGLIGTLAADPFGGSTLYAGSRPNLSLGGPPGTYKSEDGGITFRSVTPTVPNGILLDPNHRNRIYLATDGGVQTSPDGGSTWAPMNMGLPGGPVFGLASSGVSGVLHAATLSGVYEYEFESDPTVLFLDPGRSFSVTLAATDQRTGRTGSGQAIPVSSIFGYFSIPAITNNPGNPEVFVKMLDGRAINGEYWLFYGGLTDLEYTLTVTDNGTGQIKQYTKPAGSECGGSDTAAFAP